MSGSTKLVLNLADPLCTIKDTPENRAAIESAEFRFNPPLVFRAVLEEIDYFLVDGERIDVPKQ